MELHDLVLQSNGRSPGAVIKYADAACTKGAGGRKNKTLAAMGKHRSIFPFKKESLSLRIKRRHEVPLCRTGIEGKELKTPGRRFYWHYQQGFLQQSDRCR